MFSELFQTIDGKWKLFQRKETHTAVTGVLELPSSLIATTLGRDKGPIN